VNILKKECHLQGNVSENLSNCILTASFRNYLYQLTKDNGKPFLLILNCCVYIVCIFGGNGRPNSGELTWNAWCDERENTCGDPR